MERGAAGMEDKSPAVFFLAANTSAGFYSIYEDLVSPERADKIWYIKGGPGNGKSTFMRRVAAAAEAAGCRVEYILCSGDPASLDGIHILDTNTVYVDATAPHVQEPTLPGICGRYLDLSQFYKSSISVDREDASGLIRGYKKKYERAYELLSAAGKAAPANIPGAIPQEEQERLRSQGYEKALQLLPVVDGGNTTRRFLSANSCSGFLSLPETACSYGSVFLLQGGAAFFWLSGFAEGCVERGQSTILCPDPLCPDRLDAVIAPEAGVSFLTAHRGIRYPKEAVRHKLEGEPGADYTQEKALRNALLRQAYGYLKEAKDLHDRLEELYRPAVDFKALDRFADKHIREQIR